MRHPQRVFLEDPISVSYQILPLGDHESIHVLIAGEWHERPMGCRRGALSHRSDDTILPLSTFFHQYVEEISRRKGDIDLYLESVMPIPSELSYRSMTPSSWDYGLGFFRAFLDRCAPKYSPLRAFSASASRTRTFRCPHRVRVHLCDVRWIGILPLRGKSGRSRDETPYEVLATFFEASHKKVRDHQHGRTPTAAQIRYWYDFFTDTESPHFIHRLYDTALRYLKIDRQIDAIPVAYKSRREVLRRWGDTMWRAHARDAWVCMRAQEWGGFWTAIQNMGMVFMDLYLMGRLLRSFRGQSSRPRSGKPRDAMVYVGELHARNYRRLLSLMGAVTMFSSGVAHDSTDLSRSPSCVEITGLARNFRRFGNTEVIVPEGTVGTRTSSRRRRYPRSA